MHRRLSLLPICAALALPGCADLATEAARGAVSAVAQRLPAPAFGPGPASLAEIGAPLPDIAAGRPAAPRPPDLVREALAGIAAEHGPAVAARLAAAALTGGAAGVTALPAFAEGAAGAVRALEEAAASQAEIDAAYAASAAARDEAAVVPGPDRAVEAEALLRVADRASETAEDWNNPATGAGGRVVVGDYADALPGVPCRAVRREYRLGATARAGRGLICRQDGVWYDLG